MLKQQLAEDEKKQLLRIARQSIEYSVCGIPHQKPEMESLSPSLREKGVCFVTLTVRNGELRGCIGALEAKKPLALDVWEHAAAAALEDHRFSPVRPEEVQFLQIEISRLTQPQALTYDQPEDLTRLLHPFVDGVVIRYGWQRATFLPQVWEKLPTPEIFLSHLCQKMNAPGDLWRTKKLEIEIYYVEEFHE